ncbi:phosphatidylserine synthase, putative [Plasmodium vinckei brucechwatti]|uniref:Phosphatidylserine synthase, putative n=1 Tax=Plasmodium vinckei brucechwatti TaxID=119398 RepID=A0A6V7SC30_PLAVN|nr:phosphatidylserine synthase, putative [Plasmodium vinckei brucechwatti]
MIQECSVAILGLGSLLLSFATSHLDFKTRIIISSIVFVINFFSIFWFMVRHVTNIKRESFKILMFVFGALYFATVLFFHYFSINELQIVLKYIKPNIRFSKIERTYMENCNSLENIYEKFDIFVVAHILGWLGKGFILRNFLYLNVNSILFELIELKLRHILPNFYECWWDHILLDLLGCNLFGIWLSIWIMKYFKIELYKWELPGPKTNKKNIIFPKLDKLIRSIFINSNTFAVFIFSCLIMPGVDLTIFTLKAIIQIAVEEPLLIYREFVIGFFALISSYELHKAFVDKPTKKRLAPIIVIISIVAIEIIYTLRWMHVFVDDNSDRTIINAIFTTLYTAGISIYSLLFVNDYVM